MCWSFFEALALPVAGIPVCQAPPLPKRVDPLANKQCEGEPQIFHWRQFTCRAACRSRINECRFPLARVAWRRRRHHSLVVALALTKHVGYVRLSHSCRLAFGAVFYFDRPVSGAPHEVTSTAATDASGQHGGVAFTTTHWSVVLEAQGESPAAQEALEKLCRTYWRPIFAFLRRQGLRPDGGGGHHPGFFCGAIGAQKSRCRAQGKGTTSFLSPWGD